ncbi:MAG: heme-binding protein [Gammaproteobacteria bacterium]|nr:heme-binding protein [Gammaproteobacteria bacterium]
MKLHKGADYLAIGTCCGSRGNGLGPLVSNVEQAKYTVRESHGPIEMRGYLPMIIAEVSVPGDRETAIGTGFRMIADYIFGNNSQSRAIRL